jgi:hypothetical protein
MGLDIITEVTLKSVAVSDSDAVQFVSEECTASFFRVEHKNMSSKQVAEFHSTYSSTLKMEAVMFPSTISKLLADKRA